MRRRIGTWCRLRIDILATVLTAVCITPDFLTTMSKAFCSALRSLDMRLLTLMLTLRRPRLLAMVLTLGRRAPLAVDA
jgi:hypothetical protein